MSDSWRNILERAAENLSIDLDQERHSRISQQSAGWPAPRRVASQPLSVPDLLEREREVLAPGRRQARQGSPRPRAAPPSTPKSHKKGRVAGFAPAAISAGIVALAVYGIYSLLH